ncbi:MAG: hypothetical protein JXA71_10105 [Chitinispirillaceae bacterium]|nr:hypothetical protein [Chitinispirillaceae bacterium]
METTLLKRFRYLPLPGLVLAAALVFLLMLTSQGGAQTSVLVVRPEGSQFRDVVRGMADDLGNEAVVNEAIVGDRGKTIEQALRNYKPSAVVLMDNRAIEQYRAWLTARPDPLKGGPLAVALMGILVGEAIAGMPNTGAISYEIPIVTSAVNLRSILGKPIRKIGVVHRSLMAGMVERNRESCLRENLFIINRSLPDQSIFMWYHVRRALVDLLEKEKVDVLWVPNDNVLLSPSLLMNSWIPQVQKHRRPVIVGIEALVAPDLDFGTIAVLPDHEALGVQTASLILKARENGWKAGPDNNEPSLAVYKILNFRQARKWYNVPEERCSGIDRILK